MHLSILKLKVLLLILLLGMPVYRKVLEIAFIHDMLITMESSAETTSVCNASATGITLHKLAAVV